MSASDHAADMPVSKVLFFVGLQATLFTALGGVLWDLTGRALPDFVTLAIWEAAYGTALAGFLIALSAALMRVFPDFAERLVRAQAPTYPFLRHRISFPAIIFVSLCAGIGEEALFRGGLQTLLGDYLPYPHPVLLAALAFSLIHFAKPITSVFIFAIGCLFGGVYAATGSLLSVVIGHTLYDIYALWALQKAIHQLGLAGAGAPPLLHDEPSHETSCTTMNETGEDK